MPSVDAPALLITMPHSHYAEKARWGLDHLGIPYREEAHVPLLHRLATRRHGGGSVPVLVDATERLLESSAILRYADARCGGGHLYPRDAGLLQAVHALEDSFDRSFGPHTRRWAYYQVLPQRAVLFRMMTHGVPRSESRLLNLALPLVVFAIRKGLRVTHEGANRSIGRVRAVFAEVDGLLADGRGYLVGDRFTAADLTFAALAAPVLLPERGIAAYPVVDDVPSAMREVVHSLRQSRAGQFALRLYRQERRQPGATGSAGNAAPGGG